MYHQHGCYDAFDRLAEVPKHYKRCRSSKFFVLSDSGVEKDNPKCAVCGNYLKDDPKGHSPCPEGYRSNRCVYSPKSKRIVCSHYICSWTDLLGKIASLGRVMQ